MFKRYLAISKDSEMSTVIYYLMILDDEAVRHDTRHNFDTLWSKVETPQVRP